MRRVRRDRYEDVVLRTKPVFYTAMQGNTFRELVRQAAVSNVNGVTRYSGPFPGAAAARFSASTSDNDYYEVTTDASYHPGDTFSVGGWVNRLGAGDGANGSIVIHLGTGDFTVWLPVGTNAGRLVLRKAGTGDVFATTATDWGTPYTKGWQHVIFTKAGATRGLFANGSADAGGGTTSNQTIVAAVSNVNMGISPDHATGEFDGALAHWAIWNRAITAAEAAELYRAGRDSV